MGINIEGFVMYVEQAVDTLACGKMTTISTKNIFVKLQPRRTRFQSKKRWILQLLLFFSTVIVEMIYMAILIHSSTERNPNRQASKIKMATKLVTRSARLVGHCCMMGNIQYGRCKCRRSRFE